MSDLDRFKKLFKEMNIPVHFPPTDPHKRYSVGLEVDALIEVIRGTSIDQMDFWFKDGRYVACETPSWRCVRDGEEGGKWMTDGRGNR